MKDGLNLVLGKGAFEQRLILDGSADNVDAAIEAGTNQFGAAHGIADQADNVGAVLEQGACGPGTDEAGTAGDEDAAVAPEVILDRHNNSPRRAGLSRRRRGG